MNIPVSEENFAIYSNLKRLLFKKIPTVVWYMILREKIMYKYLWNYFLMLTLFWKEHPYCNATDHCNNYSITYTVHTCIPKTKHIQTKCFSFWRVGSWVKSISYHALYRFCTCLTDETFWVIILLTNKVSQWALIILLSMLNKLY